MALGELVEQMVTLSDNTACDLLLRLSGGPAAVTARLRELGIEGIRVDRSEAEMALDFEGVTDRPPASEWTRPVLRGLSEAVPPTQRRAAARAFLDDPRDTATPEAMASLLARVAHHDLLRPPNAARLWDILVATVTGPQRLKGLLPPGTIVGHKTGTGPEYEGVSVGTNDAGVIVLPGDGGHVAIAVFVNGSHRKLADRERVIAEIARSVYDHWAVPPSGPGTASTQPRRLPVP